MSIASKQIGWSEKANLLWEISKQLDRAIAVSCTGPCPTTTTTTTTETTQPLPPCIRFSISNPTESILMVGIVYCDTNRGELPIYPGTDIEICARNVGGAGLIITDIGDC